MSAAPFTCDWCAETWPHHHTEMTAPNGNVVPVVVMHPEDPYAEVRDPDTGEVIFPATKRPLRLIEGGKLPPPPADGEVQS